MSRFSPTVRPITPSPLVAALEGLYAGGEEAVQRRRDQEEQDRQRSIDDFGLRSRIEDDPRYTTERPERTPRLPSIFEGERPGEAAGRPGRPSAFGRAAGQPGRSDSFFGGVGIQREAPQASLATMVEEAAPPPVDEERPRYLPGQFVREAGMFTERPVFERPRLLRTDLVEQPEPVKPVATVAGLDVYRDPAYRTDEQKKKQTLADTLDLLGRARGGDAGALDELLVRNPDLYEAVSDVGRLTREDLAAAGVPQAAIPAALTDPILARQLVAEYNRPPSAEDGVEYTREQLASAGVPADLIPAAVNDPILARTLIGAYGKPGGPDADTTVQDLITRRTVIGQALAAVTELNRYYDPSNAESAAPYAAELAQVLSNYGYDSLEELQDDVRAMRDPRGTRPVRADRGESPPSRPAGGILDLLGGGGREPVRIPFRPGATPPEPEPEEEIDLNARYMVSPADTAALNAEIDDLVRAGYGPEEVKRRILQRTRVGR